MPVAFLLLFALIVSGCDGDSQTPTNAPTGNKEAVKKTSSADKSADKTKGADKAAATKSGDPTEISSDFPDKPPEKPKNIEPEKGFAKAGDILAAGKDPFNSKLPKIETIPDDPLPNLDDPDKPKKEPTKVANGGKPKEVLPELPPPPPPPDPLLDVSVSGIVYNPSKPMALINIAESLDGPAGGSRIVRKGDVIPVGTGNIKVVNITKTGIELMEMGKSSNKKTLSLPNLVGYQKSTPPAPTSKLRVGQEPKEKEKIVNLPGDEPTNGIQEKPTGPPPPLSPSLEKLIGLEEP